MPVSLERITPHAVMNPSPRPRPDPKQEPLLPFPEPEHAPPLPSSTAEPAAEAAYWDHCPNCGARLHNVGCKYRCLRCHYFMSCADFD